ncbi:MAG: IS1595 family transposase [Gemmatimonadetes bacterium]|nr:IS1595 family transposase [Gemmatimonadota bacterium]MYH54074.1 IS1595 family transposase [Gemmatimonadota bacterium]MYK65379.1 IS1595 family transposase [Gemmatimonadota bacterium]
MSLLALAEMFPDEESARRWFESQVWPKERCCGHCGSVRTKTVPSEKPMPYWCSDCRSYFSVRTGTVLERSKVPLRKWAYAVYILTTSVKSVPSTKLAEDIGVTQPTAWFLLQRLRKAWNHPGQRRRMRGTVEVDETYFGGKEKNKRVKSKLGRGPVGKTAVVGAKNRDTKQVSARVVGTGTPPAPVLRDFVEDTAETGSTVYSDGAWAYKTMTGFTHASVAHSRGEYVRYEKGRCIHTNGIESFWAILKRAYMGTFHWLSPKHLQRYIDEFCWRSNAHSLGTLERMELTAAGMVGKRLTYRELIGGS